MNFFNLGSQEAPPLQAKDGVSVVLSKAGTSGASSAVSSLAAKTPLTYESSNTNANNSAASNFDFSWYAGPDPIALLLESYTLSLVTAPLVVVETLQETQIHAASSTGDDSELDVYESLGVDSAANQASEAAKLPLLQADVWANVRSVAAFKGLGTLGLVKGHFTTFLHSALFQATTPVLEEALNDAFDVFDDTHPATALAANVVVAAILSPLELIRTRLIVQAANNKRYFGPFHAGAAIHSTESGPNGFSPLYYSSTIYPTILCKALSSILSSLSKSIITHDLGLHPEYNPILYTSAVLVFMAAEVFVVTPFELARKRLQLQSLRPVGSRKAGEATVPFPTLVQVSVKRYDGVFDVIRRVITEEAAPYSSANSASNKSLNVDEFDAADPYGFSSSKKASTGDWQDLYTSPTRNARSGNGYSNNNSESNKKGWFAKSWGGLRSLYRGYWTRYSIRVTEFAFEGLRDAGDNAWDI
ncbi:hypothetical protein HDU79_009369 [Rhizoclosmatium sp. JEL0117]|nr:hypothetical protein HDU79_009369 [Rhizoclosmatium sp. JEL0117]